MWTRGPRCVTPTTLLCQVRPMRYPVTNEKGGVGGWSVPGLTGGALWAVTAMSRWMWNEEKGINGPRYKRSRSQADGPEQVRDSSGEALNGVWEPGGGVDSVGRGRHAERVTGGGIVHRAVGLVSLLTPRAPGVSMGNLSSGESCRWSGGGGGGRRENKAKFLFQCDPCDIYPEWPRESGSLQLLSSPPTLAETPSRPRGPRATDPPLQGETWN